MDNSDDNGGNSENENGEDLTNDRARLMGLNLEAIFEGPERWRGHAGASERAPEAEDEPPDADAEPEEQFDITLTASHSYLSSGDTELVAVRGRSVLEAGWRARVPCVLHHGCVFPGETVPLVLLDREDTRALHDAMKRDRLFALLASNEDIEALTGYGVICEVYETAGGEAGGGVERLVPTPARFLARALHRCQLAGTEQLASRQGFNMLFRRLRTLEVVVLPELTPRDPLLPARAAATLRERLLRAQSALTTPWPLFVYDMFDVGRMRDTIKEYFKTLGLEGMMPREPVSLSFWVARNMSLAARDRLALLSVDDARLRLHMECTFIARVTVVCCGGCGAGLARRGDVCAMSSCGVHGTYANPAGYMHDVVTTARADNVLLRGRPAQEFSWFPGYAWTVLNCAGCYSHVGWRFDALRKNLRPRSFFALTNNYGAPREPEASEPREPLHVPLRQLRLP